MRSFIILVLVSLFLPVSQSFAAIHDAASCDEIEVQRVIDDPMTVDGDTVRIPAGTCRWNRGITFGTQTAWNPPAFTTKAITLQGAGAGLTIIVSAIATSPSGEGGIMFNVPTKLGGLTRITGMTLDTLQVPNLDPSIYNRPMIAIGGYSQTWVIDNMHFVVGSGHAIGVYGWTYGAIGKNRFDLHGWHYGVYVHHDWWGGVPQGDGSWIEDAYFGTNKFVFIESNTFAASSFSVAIDGWSGGRAVVRKNTFLNAMLATHGTDSAGRIRGFRAMEAYDNNFEFTLANSDGPQLRGGTFVLFNNTMKKMTPDSTWYFTNYRDLDEFSIWGKCDGLGPYDQNDNVIHDTGIHTGQNGSQILTTTENWAANQWQGYHVHNDRTGLSALIVENDQSTIKVNALTHHSPQISWNAGDSFRILRATICIDQPGRGKGILLSGDVPPWGTGVVPVGWPNQALEPSYAWGNTLNGSPIGFSSQNPWRMREGVDWFNSQKPGYTPYVYPHPLLADLGDPVPPPPSSNSAPTVTIVSPKAGQLITTKSFTISLSSSDDVGVAWLELYIGQQLVKAGAFTTMTYSWNTNPYKGKQVSIRAVARDADGLSAQSSVVVTVRK